MNTAVKAMAGSLALAYFSFAVMADTRPAPGLVDSQTLWDPPATAVHVDPGNRNDPAEDGSLTHPFDAMTDVVWSDDMVCALRRGTTLDAAAFGLGGSNVVLASYGEGARPVIRCTSVATRGRNQHAIRVDSASGLMIRDVEVQAAQATCCLRLGGGCRDVQVINCSFSGSAWGIRAFGVSGLKVVNTEVRDIKDDGMFIQGVTGVEIAHCYVHEVNTNWKPPFTPQSQAGGDAIQLSNCDDWHVHDCVLDRTNSGNKFCFIANNPNQRKGIFEHNLTRGPLPTREGGSAVYFHDGIGLIVRYNTILGPAPSALYCHTQGLKFHGNIIAGTSGGVFASRSAHMSHNVFFRIPGPSASGGRITFVNNAVESPDDAQPEAVRAKQCDMHHNLLLPAGGFAGQRLFADPEALDFRPTLNSRCIDAGEATEIERDRVGTAIPQGAGPDIGAFERP